MDYILSIDDATTTNYAQSLGYSNQTTDNKGGFIPNPETEQQFVVRMLTEHVRKSINEFNANAAFQAGLQAALKVPISVAINDPTLNPLPVILTSL